MSLRLPAFVLLLAPLLASAQESAPEPPSDPTEAATTVPAEPAVSLEEVRRFVSVFRAVQEAYVEPVDDERLMRAAIRGLLLDLDPHSAYLDQEATAALSEQASGAYGGLGLEVLQRPDRALVVVAPIDETPAARAGLRPGDVIVAIDGETVSAPDLPDPVARLRGEPGSTVDLTVEREGEVAPLEFSLVRETIRVASVRERSLAPGYVYLRIAAFQSDTGAELTRTLEQARAAAGADGLKGIVLDLRSNPGGLLHAGIEVADAFLDEGLILTTRGRLPFATSEYRAKPGDVAAGAPIVLLADGGTASAAEVVAGALRDHRRAVIMGSVSFGKGSVQTVLPVDNGDSVKLTTARYYTPGGTSIQATGIVPDILLDPDLELHRAARSGPRLREADLPGHLQGEDEGADRPASEADDALQDYAVQEALNLLKGLAVFARPAGEG